MNACLPRVSTGAFVSTFTRITRVRVCSVRFFIKPHERRYHINFEFSGSGFTGKNCEEVVRICEDDPCKNGALCLTEEGRPVCYCVPDYHGDLCQYQYDECQLGPRFNKLVLFELF